MKKRNQKSQTRRRRKNQLALLTLREVSPSRHYKTAAVQMKEKKQEPRRKTKLALLTFR